MPPKTTRTRRWNPHSEYFGVDPMAWTISLDEAAALCHYTREEARHILSEAGLLKPVDGRIRVDIDALIEWRKTS